MPLIKSTYNPSFIFRNTHINTVYKTLFYNNLITYKRTRIATPDNDFLDLDFSTTGSNTLVIALHGLEGSSKSKYIVSLVNHLNSLQIDCVAVNFRGCSGEDNNNVYSYNSGKTDDLELIINYITTNYTYATIVLVGYSMGGNITLKYVGENTAIHPVIKGAITISVPIDLEGSSNSLAHWNNKVYTNRFLKSLIKKTIQKNEHFPETNLNMELVKNAKNFADFDNVVTAPLFGYKNAQDYWRKCSSKQFLTAIKLPTLLINAVDDTFLSESCFPFKEAKSNPNLHFESPQFGGHVGFNSHIFKKDALWSENRIYEFINSIIS